MLRYRKTERSPPSPVLLPFPFLLSTVFAAAGYNRGIGYNGYPCLYWKKGPLLYHEISGHGAATPSSVLELGRRLVSLILAGLSENASLVFSVFGSCIPRLSPRVCGNNALLSTAGRRRGGMGRFSANRAASLNSAPRLAQYPVFPIDAAAVRDANAAGLFRQQSLPESCVPLDTPLPLKQTAIHSSIDIS